MDSEKNSHVSTLEIDINALKYNVSYFKKKLHSKTKLLAVVKAYAYGNDACEISKTLENNKIDYLAVAYANEGVTLREAGVKTPILVLHAQIQNYPLICEYNLEPNIYSNATLAAFLDFSTKNNLKSYPVHIKFNTGLNRLGFTEKDSNKIIESFKSNPSIKLKSVFSHLAASEDLDEKEFSLSQIRKFNYISKTISNAFKHDIIFHLTNTSGIINYPEAHFDMVRLGIGMYGFGNDSYETSKLKNVSSLKTIISQIHILEKGESLGYNMGYIAKERTKTATLPIGHADGISRELGNKKGSVLINGHVCSILGNVCMDMLMVDITDLECKERDQVIIFNSQKMVQEIAAKSKTISYEIITGISQRIKRTII